MPINRGAVRAIAGYVEEQRKRREDAYKSDQEFQQRIIAAGIASGRLEPILQGGQVTGVQAPTLVDVSTLSPRQTYAQRVGGGTLTSRGPTLAEQTYANKLGLASALAPLPIVTPPGGFPQEGFAPSEVSHPQARRLLQNRLGALQQTGLVPKPPAPTRLKTPGLTEQFRLDVQDAIAAISSGMIDKDEAIQRLINAYPDKVNMIRQLEFSLF